MLALAETTLSCLHESVNVVFLPFSLDSKLLNFVFVPQEPEWDVSSAFFANAASHIKPKGSNRKSKENKENEARREVNEC